MNWLTSLEVGGVIALGLASAVVGASVVGNHTIAFEPGIPTSDTSLPADVVEPLVPLGEWPTAVSPQDDLLWDSETIARSQLMTAVDHSLRYLDTPAAVDAYQAYPIEGITRDRVRRSLIRFRALLVLSQSPADFYEAVQREFVLYRSIGHDGEGTVHFTGYFEPSFQASRVPTEAYRYPLYQRPLDLEAWDLPHPTRLALEGTDGEQGHQGPLKGLELVWLSDRLEAFLVQVQGSARLQLTDGTFMSVGYAGRTEFPYTSIGRELINDGKIPETELTLDRLLTHFQLHPEELDDYLPRNNRFVFFRETAGGPPSGTFSFPVTAGRSIATDKTLMPPGAIALITLDWPPSDPASQLPAQPISRYVLNQDTGGAIKGPGRVDIFVGSGDAAGAQAGQINTDGYLYYLLLRR